MRASLGVATNYGRMAIVAGSLAAVTSVGCGRRTPAELRTADGKPNLSGIWQVMNTANWDIEPHSGRQGPVFSLGAAFSAPPGLGVVEGGKIPYQPEAAQKKKENLASWTKLDPEVHCYLPGVPRATYMPYPFQIVQTPDSILFAYEYASASRVVHMKPVKPLGVDAWMGQSQGHWEGDTLVIDVTSLNDRTWFDRSGDFHSSELKVTERYTPIDHNTLQYEATIEDPKTFTRPWKMSMPIYRHREKNFQLLEYKCVEFVEELEYGDLRKSGGQE